MSTVRISHLIGEADLAELERDYAEGLTSHQIVELLRRQGARFSEATLRKYVQLGLLPRSRRVGLKGKHRGSQGLYPVSVVRRLDRIKALMGDGRTIEEVRELLVQSVEVGGLREELERVLGALERRLAGVTGVSARVSQLKLEIEQARFGARELVRRIERLDREVRPAVKRPVVAVPPAPPGAAAKS